MADQSRDDLVARTYLKNERKQAERVAELLPRAPGTRTLDEDDERLLFWARDVKVDEQSLWQEAMVAGLQMGLQTLEQVKHEFGPEVVMKMYPERLPVMRAGGRIDPDAQVRFCAKMSRLGPPGSEDEEGRPTRTFNQSAAPATGEGSSNGSGY